MDQYRLFKIANGFAYFKSYDNKVIRILVSCFISADILANKNYYLHEIDNFGTVEELGVFNTEA